mgnify:CR=1 FL=1|jgi:hypothetical protein|tara:strand:+ start:11298 stop:11510 length:213 start_codon:yes stop_codon:yes gene_type:complete
MKKTCWICNSILIYDDAYGYEICKNPNCCHEYSFKNKLKMKILKYAPFTNKKKNKMIREQVLLIIEEVEE